MYLRLSSPAHPYEHVCSQHRSASTKQTSTSCTSSSAHHPSRQQDPRCPTSSHVMEFSPGDASHFFHLLQSSSVRSQVPTNSLMAWLHFLSAQFLRLESESIFFTSLCGDGRAKPSLRAVGVFSLLECHHIGVSSHLLYGESSTQIHTCHKCPHQILRPTGRTQENKAWTAPHFVPSKNLKMYVTSPHLSHKCVCTEDFPEQS